MLFLSSVHVHVGGASAESECAECVAHHCPGHIDQSDVAWGECLLCQFLTLSYAAAALVAITVFFNVLWMLRSPLPCGVCRGEWGCNVVRGPPVG